VSAIGNALLLAVSAIDNALLLTGTGHCKSMEIRVVLAFHNIKCYDTSTGVRTVLKSSIVVPFSMSVNLLAKCWIKGLGLVMRKTLELQDYHRRILGTRMWQ
jgi:hypothetical protein